MKANHSPNFPNPLHNDIIRRYQEMKESGKSAYFEPEEITVIVNYYLKLDNFKTADEVLDYALKIHPTNSEILYMKGHNLVHEHRYDEASEVLKQIPSTDRFEVAMLKGELLIMQKKVEEAEDVFKRLYEKEQDPYIALDIAEIYITAHKKKEALKWLKVAGEPDSTDEDIMGCYSRYYHTFGEHKKSIELSKKLLDKDPYNLGEWQDLARAYIYMNEVEDAINALEFALAIDEDNLLTLELMGNCYLLVENYEKAIEFLKKVEELSENKNTSRMSLISAYMCLQDYQKVIEYSDKVLANKQLPKIDLCLTYQNRCNAFISLGQADKGRESIDKALTLNKHSDLLYYISGELYLIVGDLENAKIAFEQARKYSKSPVNILSDIGYSYLHHGYLSESLELFEEMEDNFKEEMREEFYYMLYAYYKLDNIEKAVCYLLKGMMAAPEFLIRTDTWLPSEDEKEFAGFLEKYLPKLVKIGLGEEDPNNLMK